MSRQFKCIGRCWFRSDFWALGSGGLFADHVLNGGIALAHLDRESIEELFAFQLRNLAHLHVSAGRAGAVYAGDRVPFRVHVENRTGSPRHAIRLLCEDAQAWIEARTKRKLSLPGVYSLLGKAGGVLKVPRKAHAKKDAAKAEAFKASLAEKLAEASAGAEGPVRLWVLDEHRYGLLPVIRRCWGLRGECRVPAAAHAVRLRRARFPAGDGGIADDTVGADRHTIAQANSPFKEAVDVDADVATALQSTAQIKASWVGKMHAGGK